MDVQFDTEFHPEKVHDTCWIAPGAVVRGDVTLGPETSVWFNCMLRGDTTPVVIGARSNIQDLSVFHADPGYPCTLGEGVTVGHRAIVHGATVGDNVMIGMGAILLNGCQIGENSVVAAGTLIPERKVFPPGVMIMGFPGKVVRELTEDEIKGLRFVCETYVARSRAFMEADRAD